MAENPTNPGIEALKKAGYSNEEIGAFAQIYMDRKKAMGAGQKLVAEYTPNQFDNDSLLTQFSVNFANATLPPLIKGIALAPKILANAAGFTPQVLDDVTNGIIKGIDDNYIGYINPMDNRGMFVKDENGQWGLSDVRSVVNGLGSGLGSMISFLGLAYATGGATAAGSILPSMSTIAAGTLMSVSDIWQQGKDAGLRDVDNARMTMALAPVVGAIEDIGGFKTGFLKALGKEVIEEVPEMAIKRSLKSSGIKEAMSILGNSIPDEAAFREATKASIRKLSTWGAKLGSEKTLGSMAGNAGEEYLQNVVLKAGQQMYDTWFAEPEAKVKEGKYGTELIVSETDERGIGPSVLGYKYNVDQFNDDLSAAIYGGVIGYGMSSFTTPVVDQSLYGYVDLAVKKGKVDGTLKQIAGLVQQNVQEGKMDQAQAELAMKRVNEMAGLSTMLKDTPRPLSAALKYAVWDNQYNKLPAYGDKMSAFQGAADQLAQMLETNMAGVAQVAVSQDSLRKAYPEFRKSEMKSEATQNYIKSVVTSGKPTNLVEQIAQIDKMEFDIMDDDRFKDLMRGYMLALPQIGGESTGFPETTRPPSAPPSGPGAPPTPPPSGAGTTPPPSGQAGTPAGAGTPPTAPPSAPAPPPTEEQEVEAPPVQPSSPSTWIQAMNAPVVYGGREGTVVYDDVDGFLFLPDGSTEEVVLTKDTSQDPTTFGITFSNEYNPTENAFQEQTTDESVLRPEQPEMGLQQMGKGDQEPQVATQEGEEKEIKVSGKNVRLYGKPYKIVSVTKDEKGNPVSVTLERPDGSRVTSRNEDLMLAILAEEEVEAAAQKTKEEQDAAIEEVLSEDYPDGVPPHIAAFHRMIDAMPDDVAEVLELMEKDYRQFPDELRGMIARAREWMDEMIFYVRNNPKFTQEQKDELVAMFDQFNENLINYYYAIGEEKSAQEIEQQQQPAAEPIQPQVTDETTPPVFGTEEEGVEQVEVVVPNPATAEMQKEVADVEVPEETKTEIDAEAEKIVAGGDQETEQSLDSLGAPLESEGETGRTEGAGVRPEVVPQPKGAAEDTGIPGQATEGEQQGAAAESGQGAVQAAPAGERGQVEQPPVLTGTIPDRYNQAEKIVSVWDQDEPLEVVIANGERRMVKVILGDAFTITPSHDPFTFTSSEGFIKNEDGQNANTNDYTDPKNIEMVSDFANKFDSRALDEFPFVKNGFVLSGNNRTMSRQLSAIQKTDTEYLKSVRKRAARLGFTQEQINSFKYPFIWYEIQDDIAPSSLEFAKYNLPKDKPQDPVAEAVSLGKIIPNEKMEYFSNLLLNYDTTSEFLNSKDAVEFINSLLRDRILNLQKVQSFIRDGALTDNGKTFIKSLMLGKVMSGPNVLKFSESGYVSITNRIMYAITDLVKNFGMKDYSIIEGLNNALDVQRAIIDLKEKNPGLSYESALRAYISSGTLDLYKKRVDPLSVLMNVLLNKGDREFKNAMVLYNNAAEAASKGTIDMFGASKPKSKEDIISEVMNNYLGGNKLAPFEKQLIKDYQQFIASGTPINEVNNVDQARKTQNDVDNDLDDLFKPGCK